MTQEYRGEDLVCTTALTPTEGQYQALQLAYAHFNRTLFGGCLPPCLITLQRRNNTFGYYSPGKFATLNNDGTHTDELALNPAHFRSRGARDVFSTLVHEMAHLQQQHFGKGSRNGYHSKAWAFEMRRIGLQPSHTGEPGGQETGYRMSHYIIEGGLYDLAYEKLAQTVSLTWGDAITAKDGAVTTKGGRAPDPGSAPKPKRIKFVCPNCVFNAYAVPSAAGRIACIPCGNRPMVTVETDH
jgi:hypothetical protein